MPEPTHRWRRYVAIGDSLTEGLVDPYPNGEPRGWADRFAQHLADAAGESIDYANLAIRGRLLRPIIAEQLEPALALQPELVSLWGGGNDILRPRADVDAITAELERAVVRLREAGVDVLLGTGIDAKGSPLLDLTRSRTALFNANVWSIARRHGAFVIDVWGMRCLKHWGMWFDDRLHFNSIGHERVSQAALVAVGLPASDGWDDPLPELPAKTRREWLDWQLSWARQHAGPWLGRRIRRTSSGAGRSAKLPEYVAVPPRSPQPAE
ncbi:SGNH/GDSL hydrolase family protein [Micropruina sonneratiae]|uniref:SGNH/GDSL hydrolase family protein n=1 Tax=Micropruina sonneratiae TaxID=2986940 RepID=UPI0022277FC6|nr:SGNH/GDSL hydrolase family protein [Micropruina sp. KQZ13P-5]MCW3158214.1 SGNH/GDSL hydrolase family protein [Micropruina sp. KQZ13P-5]